MESGIKKMKKNDGSSSNQSIGLDDETEKNGGAGIRATVPKKNQHVMENKWEKDMIARDGATSKMSNT